MRQRLATFAAVVAVAGAASVTVSTASAQAQIEWKQCGSSYELACGHLTVPLDPSGATPGTLTLALRRHRAPVGESPDAVIALAGGPGQSAIPFTEQFTEVLGPIAATRDLIVFDQRGTGFSHPLSCAAFEHLTGSSSLGVVGICAGQLGTTRGLFTTEQTVADIEAIRQAAGYEKLVLYGTSYGTKVAERYAQEYPSHVEALVLDSVVPPAGPEPFDLTSFAAVDRVLRQLCSADECKRSTPNPVADLRRLVRRLAHGKLRARAIDERGVAHAVRVSSSDLMDILVQGDLDPILRAEFPAAIRAADDGENAPLGRLLERAGGGETESEPEAASEGFDWPLYYATICDETSFPWNTAGSPTARLREIDAVLHAEPANAFGPFTASDALALSDAPACAHWPVTPSPAPASQAPMPNVPTLILSGADDLRTPTANARMVAREIPDAELLVVPNTGHSVLGSDPTSCSEHALQALFANKSVQRCTDTVAPPLLDPTELPPDKLTRLPAAGHNHGLAGRAVTGAILTLGDLAHQIVIKAFERASLSGLLSGGSLRTGGLLAGWGSVGNGSFELHGYSYIPGLTVSGKIKAGSAKLRIGGWAAPHGTIEIDAHGKLDGVLGGRHVHLVSASTNHIGADAVQLALRSPLLHLSSKTAERSLLSRGRSALLRYLTDSAG